MNMKQAIIILVIIIVLLTITTVIFINIFFFSEASLPSSEPKEGAVVQEMPEASPSEPLPRIPDSQEKPQPSYVIPPTRIPTPQETEERANNNAEKLAALEEMKSKMDRESESTRAEAFRQLKEAEAALLSANPEEARQAAAETMLSEKKSAPLTEEEIKKMRSQE